jgi:hypothetical protein
MVMAEAPSEPGAVVRVGRDATACRLVTPQDWLFVSRVHVEFRCLPDLGWTVTWCRGSQAEPSSELRIVSGGVVEAVPYGGTWTLPRGGSGEVIIQDRTGPRTVNIGFYHEM